MLKRFCGALSVTIFTCSSAFAQMYSDAVLEKKVRDQRTNIEFTVFEQLIGPLPADVRFRLDGITLEMPLRDEINVGAPPMTAYADSRGRRIILPASTLQFWGDLPVVWAWFIHRRCDPTPLIAYVRNVVRGRETTPPFEHFGLSFGALVRVPFVDKLSLDITNTAVNFILAHEMGHIFYGDAGSQQPGAKQRELRADAFALEVLAAANIPPIGIVQFFTAARFADPLALDAVQSSHPISPDRLAVIADRIREQPLDYVNPNLSADRKEEDRGRIVSIADAIDAIAKKMLDDRIIGGIYEGWDEVYSARVAPLACPI